MGRFAYFQKPFRNPASCFPLSSSPPLSPKQISPFQSSTTMSISFNLLHLPFTKTLQRPTHLPPPPTRSLTLRCLSPSSTGGVGGPTATLATVINPALSHANILYFRSGYNVQIVVDEGEPEEVLLRRFRREVSKAGVIQECKRRRFFENKQEEKKRKKREAGKRNRRRRLGPRFNSSSPQPDAEATKKAREEDDDNWDLPEGNLPF